MKEKRGQVMGLPFGVIFSILITIFIIIAAFTGIKYFLNLKKCTDTGLFFSDLQSEIDRAWNTQASNFSFKSTLPQDVEYVCFANFTKSFSGNSNERKIFDELKKYPQEGNLFLYPKPKKCSFSKEIKHINMTDMRNPYCIKNSDKIEITITKSFYESLVRVG